MKDLTKPCGQCPFARWVKPGALGGSPVSMYLGQSIGPFMLPCHKACDFDDPEWKSKIGNVSQCAGAAIYRANVGVSAAMPKGLLSLPKDTDNVFATHAEFMAHHLGMPIDQAERETRPLDMQLRLAYELQKPEVKLVEKK